MRVNGSGRVSTAVFAVLLAVVAIVGCDQGQRPAEIDTVAVVDEIAIEEDAASAAEPAIERIPEPGDLVGAWLLEDLGGRGVMDIVQTTIAFDGEGGVSGGAGCNRYTGGYTFEDGQLAFGPMAATKMMCPEAVMAQEDGFLGALGSVERVAVNGPFLLVHVAGLEAPLKFTRMEAEAAE